jgi:hypothetical protein
MALRKNIQTEGKSLVQTDWGVIDNGTQFLSFAAYIKVENVYGDKTQLTANVSFKGETQSFIKQYQIPASVAPDSANFIAQAYAYLKTLPDFAGAIDC